MSEKLTQGVKASIFHSESSELSVNHSVFIQLIRNFTYILKEAVRKVLLLRTVLRSCIN